MLLTVGGRHYKYHRHDAYRSSQLDYKYPAQKTLQPATEPYAYHNNAVQTLITCFNIILPSTLVSQVVLSPQVSR